MHHDRLCGLVGLEADVPGLLFIFRGSAFNPLDDLARCRADRLHGGAQHFAGDAIAGKVEMASGLHSVVGQYGEGYGLGLKLPLLLALAAVVLVELFVRPLVHGGSTLGRNRLFLFYLDGSTSAQPLCSACDRLVNKLNATGTNPGLDLRQQVFASGRRVMLGCFGKRFAIGLRDIKDGSNAEACNPAGLPVLRGFFFLAANDWSKDADSFLTFANETVHALPAPKACNMACGWALERNQHLITKRIGVKRLMVVSQRRKASFCLAASVSAARALMLWSMVAVRS